MMEIRVARAGQELSSEDAADGLLILNRYLDFLNATKRALYSTTQTTFALTSGLQPHTIGVTANTPTFTVSVARPVKILSANIIMAGNIRVPLEIVDSQGWDDIRAGAASGQSVTITSSIPRYLMYDPDWPNGSIYLWPVPTANSIELRFETLLADLALTDTFTLPPGYQEALCLTLAERLAPGFGQKVAPETRIAAREARAQVWGNNDEILNAIPDGGTQAGRGGGFNFLTGQVGSAIR